MERSKTGAECLYEQHDIHKFYAYVFNIWTSLATLDPRYTIALNKTDQKSCSIRVNIINFINQSKSFKTKTIYAKNKKFQWTGHKIWSNKPILEKNWLSEPKNYAQHGSKLSTLYTNANHLRLRLFIEKIKKLDEQLLRYGGIDLNQAKVWPFDPKNYAQYGSKLPTL